METQDNKWKTAFFVLLFVILAAVMAVTTFLIGRNQATVENESGEQQAVNIPTQPIVIPTETPTPIIDESAQVKQAVYDLTELTEKEAEVVITDLREKFAKGNIKEYEAVGGAYWLAAKTPEGWVGVYDGQSHPQCLIIELYEFPTDLVPECLDEDNEIITR